jgi:rSAM/selenodomain-associated transferase 1
VRFPDSRILIFAKAPVAGYAKTRLIPWLGEAGAAALAEGLVRGTLDKVLCAGLAPVELWCAPDVDHPLFRELCQDLRISCHIQHPGDLGERMWRAMAAASRRSPKVLLIGCDVPAMDSDWLAAALTALDEGLDGVLGPVEDGGYWLIGLARVDQRLFTGIPWSGPEVAAATRRRFSELGYRWRELPETWDLDDGDDLARFRALAGARLAE